MESKNRFNLIGLLGVSIILEVIWNRLRTRSTHSLIDNSHPITQFCLQITSVVVLISIVLTIYKRYFSSNDNNNDNFMGKILVKIQNLTIIRNISKYSFIFKLIMIHKTMGIYNYILCKTFDLIENTSIPVIFEGVFNLFVFKHPVPEGNRDEKILIKDLCNNKWTRFLFDNIYFVFKLIPVISLQTIGIFEIYYYYEINYYYKFLFILLPYFCFNIIRKQQIYYHTGETDKLTEIYKIDHEFVFIVDNYERKFYNINDILFKINAEYNQMIDKEERKELFKTYKHHAIRKAAAAELGFEIYNHPIWDLLLMILTEIFLLSLPFY